MSFDPFEIPDYDPGMSWIDREQKSGYEEFEPEENSMFEYEYEEVE